MLLNPLAGFDEDIENMLIACVVDAELVELTHQMTGSGLRRHSEDGDLDRSQTVESSCQHQCSPDLDTRNVKELMSRCIHMAEQRQETLCKPEASLVCMASSRPTRGL